MKSFFEPAIFVLNRLRYPQKFLLITALFALPLGVVMWICLSIIQHDIEFSGRERVGVAYIRPLDDVVQHIQQHRALTVSYLSGAPEFKARYEAKQLEIAADMRRVEELDVRVGTLLES